MSFHKKYHCLTRFLTISFLLYAGISAQDNYDVSISGSVTDGGGTGIEGAEVSLLSAGLSTSTDGNGDYSLSGNVTDIKKASVLRGNAFSSPVFSKGKIWFSIREEETEVNISLFELSGRCVTTVLNRKLKTGNYSLVPAFESFSSQFYLINISLGNNNYVLKCPVFEEYRSSGNVLSRKDGFNNLFLKKSAAVNDTIRVSKPGYSEQNKAVDSYSGVHDFTLQSADFGLFSPQNNDMITGTHTPSLQWNTAQNADHYEVWMNITRSDYDWEEPGSLLERYTKIGETTETEFTTDSIMDRWTYKWYVVAVESGGSRTSSEIRQFSLYNPGLEQVDDGISLIDAGGYMVRDLNKDGSVQPFEDWHNSPEVRVDDLLGRMTIQQKAQQLFYDDAGFVCEEGGWMYYWPLSPQRIKENMLTCAGSEFGIPFISAGDQIHGLKVTYPTGPGLAATRNLEIVYKCGDLQRRCHRISAAFGTLGPVSEINTCQDYARVQEGLGEDARFAAGMARALIAGFHGGPELNPSSMLETLKHWPSQGAGGEDAVEYDWVTIKYHMKPWIAAIEAGLANVMPGYAGCSLLATEGRGAGDDPGIIGYLRDTLGYDGLITTDWLPAGSWINAINAGSDVMGGGNCSNAGTITGGDVPEERITDACRRVLDVKFRMGIFEDPYPASSDVCETKWEEYRQEGIHVDAARQSLTLIKNNGILPLNLNSGDDVVAAGGCANNTSCTYAWYSGWNEGEKTFSWWIQQKAENAGYTFHSGTAADPEVGIFIVGENTYTHGTDWPMDQRTLPDGELNPIRTFHDAGIPVVVVFIMPRPYLIEWAHNNADAVIVAYRPGDGGPQALAELIFGDIEPGGVLSFQLPRDESQIMNDDVSLPYDMGATSAEREEIRQLIDNNQHVPYTYGDPLYQCGFGITAW